LRARLALPSLGGLQRHLPFLLAAVVAVLLAAVLLPRHNDHRNLVRANPALTPGPLNPDVTQATIGSTICVSGWTKTVRPPSSYTHALELRQLREYGESGPTSNFQEDHFISLELGGAPTDPRNLWPEPQPRASEVDKIENQLNDEVCSGQITLAEGQRREAELKYRDG
jgi:hypothetical protein